jgi:hypothetical protein
VQFGKKYITVLRPYIKIVLHEAFSLVFLGSWRSSMNLVFRKEHGVSETGSDSILGYKRIGKDLLSLIRETELVSITGHILPEDGNRSSSRKVLFSS